MPIVFVCCNSIASSRTTNRKTCLKIKIAIGNGIRQEERFPREKEDFGECETKNFWDFHAIRENREEVNVLKEIRSSEIMEPERRLIQLQRSETIREMKVHLSTTHAHTPPLHPLQKRTFLTGWRYFVKSWTAPVEDGPWCCWRSMRSLKIRTRHSNNVIKENSRAPEHVSTPGGLTCLLSKHVQTN